VISRILPPLALGPPVALLAGNGHFLLALSSSAQLWCWNVKLKKAVFPPASLNSILVGSPNNVVTNVSISSSGAPLIQIADEVVYSYDADLLSFVKVTERWWAENSGAWQGRARAPQSIRGAMSQVENSLKTSSGGSLAADRPARPEWWDTAITLGHLETRAHGIKLLDSAAEYRQVVLIYANKIADEGFRAKAEELIKELYGPVYWRPGRGDTSTSATVCGIPRRDLLKDVLSIFARSKTLARLGLDWQDTLKKADREEL